MSAAGVALGMVLCIDGRAAVYSHGCWIAFVFYLLAVFPDVQQYACGIHEQVVVAKEAFPRSADVNRLLS